MPYTPPSGWIEQPEPDLDTAEPRQFTAVRFHSSDECHEIPDGQQLVAVDRPYSAARCPACAKE